MNRTRTVVYTLWLAVVVGWVVWNRVLRPPLAPGRTGTRIVVPSSAREVTDVTSGVRSSVFVPGRSYALVFIKTLCHACGTESPAIRGFLRSVHADYRAVVALDNAELAQTYAQTELKDSVPVLSFVRKSMGDSLEIQAVPMFVVVDRSLHPLLEQVGVPRWWQVAWINYRLP